MVVAGISGLTAIIYALKKGVKKSKCCCGEVELSSDNASPGGGGGHNNGKTKGLEITPSVFKKIIGK